MIVFRYFALLVIITAAASCQQPHSATFVPNADDPNKESMTDAPLRNVTVLKGHEKLITGLLFRGGSRELISTGWDASVRVWDLQYRREIGRFIGHTSDVIGIALSPDQKLLATCGQMDGIVRVWDVSTRKQVAQIGPDIRDANAAFSPDGMRLAVTDFGCTRVFSTSGYHEILQFKIPITQQASVRFSLDGTYALTVTQRYGAFVWNAKTGEQIRRFSAGQPVLQIGDADFKESLPPLSWYGDFSPDSTKIVLCSQDGARVWDIGTGKLLYFLNALDPHMAGPDFGCAVGACDAHFSPDGRHVAIVGGGEALWIVDTTSWKREARYHPSLFAHPLDEGYFTTCAWSPESRYVATANTESEIYIVKIEALLNSGK